ncbi:DUF4189 domain-containing protein [Shimia sp. Alg240-R146]|uniref:DUF4189 domain-containing protein n=1 Tax=Shimia sp. Alg240-R146 TaxID=2993449 RepID=UPI0022E9139E|nr:DUF4189 domain-containing protein [Shimia sp. Alg240-R146]
MRFFKPMLGLVLSVLASASMAGECGYNVCWGAVGIGPNGAWGYSHSQQSESEARLAVRSACEGDCNVIETFYNACGAMAEGSDGNWGFGWAEARGPAEETALDYCGEHGPNCAVRVWACSK